MECVYKRPESLTPYPMMFCPSCHHAILIKLVAEVLDEMNLRERAVLAAPDWMRRYDGAFRQL